MTKGTKIGLAVCVSVIAIIAVVLTIGKLLSTNDSTNEISADAAPSLQTQDNPSISLDSKTNSLANSKLDDLKQYALAKINDDRAKFGLNPVKLSDNNAAQIHAEDMLATQELSHWTTDGMKPYMKYSVNGGTYAVAQNAAMQWTYGNGNIANFRLDLCGSNDFFCVTSEIKSAIDSLEYEMMYNDMDCCDNGHRDNILDKYHTHVSIGIAYNSYEITYIQNFENQYITWIQPITYNEKAGNIFMKGTLAEAVEIKGINMYFDANPTPTSYEQHRDDTFYSFGDLASVVVSPAPPGWYYDKPSDYTLIEAETWDISGQDFEISFDSNRVTDLHGSGVYTVVMFVTDGGNDWDATTSSLFVQ